MSKLVFVDTQADGAGWVFNDNAAFGGGTTGVVGIWAIEGSNVPGDHMHATADVIVGAGGIIPTKFQIDQVVNSGNSMPYASPIIHSSDVKRITYTGYDAGAKAATSASTFDVQVVGNTFGIKIVTKGGANTVYTEFTDPTTDYHARTGQVFNYEHKATVTTAATNAQAIVDAINNDEASPVTATISTADVTITAKDYDTSFQVIDLNTSDSGTYTAIAMDADTLVGTFAADHGYGNLWQAKAEERQYGYQTGLHNRLWLPQTPTYFSDSASASTFDILTFEIDRNYRDGAPGNDSLQIDIYIPSGAAAGGSLNEQFVGAGTGAGTTWAAPGAGVTHILYTRS